MKCSLCFLLVIVVVFSVFPIMVSGSIEPVFEEIDDGSVEWVTDVVYSGYFGLRLFNPGQCVFLF